MTEDIYTIMYIVGPYKEMQAFYEKLNLWIQESKKIYDLVTKANLSIQLNPAHINGYIDTIISPTIQSKKDSIIKLSIWSSYQFWTDVWDAILKKYTPHCQYFYFSEDWSMGEYYTNDKDKRFFIGDYGIDTYCETEEQFKILDIMGLENESITFVTEEVLKQMLQEIFQDNKKLTIDKLLDNFSKITESWKENSNGCIYINKIEVIPHNFRTIK